MGSGIYKIENLTNGKIYIGSAQDLIRRWQCHIYRLNKGTHKNQHLQNAWNLYGNFVFNIIEECCPDSLIEREQYYIDTMKPEYNVCRVAGSSRGITPSLETRAKLSIAVSAGLKGHRVSLETRAKLSAANKGWKPSPKMLSAAFLANKGCKRPVETGRKISVAKMGHEVSPETRAKISTSKKGRKPFLSSEIRARKSMIMRGNIHALGHKNSQEVRKKKSDSQKIRRKREKENVHV